MCSNSEQFLKLPGISLSQNPYVRTVTPQPYYLLPVGEKTNLRWKHKTYSFPIIGGGVKGPVKKIKGKKGIRGTHTLKTQFKYPDAAETKKIIKANQDLGTINTAIKENTNTLNDILYQSRGTNTILYTGLAPIIEPRPQNVKVKMD